MKRSTKEILNRPYARILIPDDDGTYTAEILEFPGCYAEGDTAEEAIKDLEQAAASWIEAALQQQQDIPEPLDAYGYSGRISLRLPKSIHKQAARFAQRDDVSLNQFFTNAIAAKIGAEELYERLAQRLESRLPFATAIVNVVRISSTVMFPVQSSEISLQSHFTEAILGQSPPLDVESKRVSADD